MEDFEVRQALNAIKERVDKMTAENNWQENMADEWNQAQVDKAAARQVKVDNGDNESRVTYVTGASAASKVSYQSRKSELKKENAIKQDKQWDQSTTCSKANAEDRIAAKIASEVLKDNAKLRGVHSGQSIKVLLEREAKR